MPEFAGSVGRWMLLAALLVLLAGALAVLPRLLAVIRRVRRLLALISEVETDLTAGWVSWLEKREEMERLWRPWGLMLKWGTHPLTTAVLKSYARRWRQVG
jgi:hypothetical protein